MSAPPSKELGQSEIASELVPGSIEQLHGQVTDLRQEAKKVAGLEESFRAVRIRGWVGTASEDWEDEFDDECTKWALLGTVLTTTATAMNTYTHALSGAQAKAREAIALYKRGDALTASAQADWQKALDAYLCPQPSTRDLTTAELISGKQVQRARPAHPGPFQDPGAELRDQARAILATARADLDEAGDEALGALGEQNSARRRTTMDFFGSERGISGPTLDWTIWEKKFGSYGGHDNGSPSPFRITLGSVEGSLYVYGADGEFTEYYGDVKVTGDGRIVVLEAGGSAEASVSPDGLTLDADARLALVTAEGTVRGEYGAFQAAVGGDASVGAEAHGGLTLTKGGVSGGVEAFFGARAGVHGQVGAGGVTVSGGAEARVGLGAGADLEAGAKNGKLTIDVSAGATVIFGAKVEFGVEIDFQEAGETIADAADAVVFWDD